MNLNFTITDAGADVSCHNCKKAIFVAGVTQAQIDSWKNGGLIQNVMPQVSEDQRELFISGTCGDCWEAIFDGMDTDPDEDNGVEWLHGEASIHACSNTQPPCRGRNQAGISGRQRGATGPYAGIREGTQGAP